MLFPIVTSKVKDFYFFRNKGFSKKKTALALAYIVGNFTNIYETDSEHLDSEQEFVDYAEFSIGFEPTTLSAVESSMATAFV